jgi:S1-C subfamily serine protease
MSRRLCLAVLLALPTFFVLQHLGALEADEPAVAPAGGTLLERLSAETTALAARGERASAHLLSEKGAWVGVMVGEPARFVMALEPSAVVAELPRTAKLRQAGRDEVDASLLDADADLGLAIYAHRTSRSDSRSGADALAGALAVVGDAARPALVTLATSRGPLEDLPPLAEASGVALLAPGGALLGLAASSAFADVQGCAACHMVDAGTHPLAGRFVSADGTQAWGASATTPSLAVAHSWLPGVVRAQWLRSSQESLLAAFAGQAQDAGGVWATQAQDRGAFVPGTVIARALEDVSGGRRLGHAYLGVVPEGATSDKFVITSRDGARVRAVLLPRYVEAGGDGGAASLPSAHGAFVRLSQVLADSPAARAGLRAGQDVLEIDGVQVRGAAHFARMLARRRSGETVRLAVRGLAEPVSVVLGDREKEGRSLATALSVGLEAQALTAELSAFLGVQLGEGGVVVRSTLGDRAAAQAGLRHGDVIRDGGGGPIRDLAELDAVLGAAREAVAGGRARGPAHRREARPAQAGAGPPAPLSGPPGRRTARAGDRPGRGGGLGSAPEGGGEARELDVPVQDDLVAVLELDLGSTRGLDGPVHVLEVEGQPAGERDGAAHEEQVLLAVGVLVVAVRDGAQREGRWRMGASIMVS